MSRSPSSLTFVYPVLLFTLVHSFIWQSDVLTIFLDEGINQFESFVRDRFHYRLAINKKYYYFDCRFLNSSHRPAAEVQPSDVIDTFELEESSQDYRINVTNQQNDKTKWLSYRFRDKTGKVESNQLASMDEVERVQVKFLEDDAGIGFLIYYDQHNDETNKTIWLLHFAYDGSHSTQLHYSWKTSSARRAAQSIQIIPQSSSEFYFLYYDTFNKANYSTDQRFVNFNADSMLLPYVGLYPVLIANNPKIKTYLQTPVFCAPDYAGQWDQKLSTYLVDAYRATSERGTSFYFLLDNRFDQSQTVCVMNPQELASAFGTNAEFLCDDTRNDKCTPKKPPLIDVVLRFEKSAYQRILVKQFYDQNTQLETSILFLLEKDFKQQLVIYNLIQKGNETGKSLCFEGIYKLRSQKELILDIQLENKTDSLLIITRNYIQRIPIGSFCTANSFSSCQSASTCTLRNSTCQNPERFKSGCLDPSKLPKSKMTSEEYMCDRETRDACLTGQVKPQTKANYQGKLCNEDSCLCQNELCIPNSACTFDEVHLHYCFLPRSKLKLSSYEIGQPYEPFATIIVSSFITLLAIAFFLITFYCCFSMTQSSKKRTALSDLTTTDLSKIEIKEIK